MHPFREFVNYLVQEELVARLVQRQKWGWGGVVDKRKIRKE